MEEVLCARDVEYCNVSSQLRREIKSMIGMINNLMITNSWKKYAMKAIEILDNTTILSDHNQNHEEALKELKGLLKN